MVTEKQARYAYEKKEYLKAASFYFELERSFLADKDELMAAEMANNRSVALLMAGKPQEALDAANKTNEIFSSCGDKKREAISLANQAAATQALGQKIQALEIYRQASTLLHETGNQDYRAYILKKISTLELQLGMPYEALANAAIAVDNQVTQPSGIDY